MAFLVQKVPLSEGGELAWSLEPNSPGQLFDKERPGRIKPLLYLYRTLLTGLHLMRPGQVEANLNPLSEGFKLPYLPDLIACKTAGPEEATLTPMKSYLSLPHKHRFDLPSEFQDADVRYSESLGHDLSYCLMFTKPA